MNAPYAARTTFRQPAPRRRHSRRPAVIILAVVIAALGAGAYWRYRVATASTAAPAPLHQQTAAGTPGPAAQQPAVHARACAGNTAGQEIVVSIGQRHLWACDGTSQKYDSAVVTGMENLPADLTPTGTYHIYAKQTGLYLDGSDSTGSWHDYVYYWMPFLSNQYGVYGFHDATWRKPGDFGAISPYSSNASHGCVELPLSTAKWMYDWAPVGTTVTIES